MAEKELQARKMLAKARKTKR